MARPRATRRKNGRGTSERDSLDFRDWIYEPTLRALPEACLPRKGWLHVLDQGEEGACTGFGLAAVVNYLIRARGGGAGERVSARMLYEMAKRHDHWPGHRYDGSTSRGAMKGWAKNGVCLDTHWPYELEDPGELSAQARQSALAYPLGAYYRVLPKRSDVHAALTETGILFASAATHRGWDEVGEDGRIPFDPGWSEQGGHAFAIVGYTERGFLIQNSWNEDWGGVRVNRTVYPGCALWQYDDFDAHVWDLWVAQLARPYESVEALLRSSEKRTAAVTADKRPQRPGPPREAIRDHFVHIDDGRFDPYGDFWSTEAEARRVVKSAVQGGARHLLLFAHGGLSDVKEAAWRAARWTAALAANGIHEIHFIWETGLLAELKDVLLGKDEFVKERAGGPSDWTDAWLERTTGPLGRGIWHEMLSDARLAFEPKGAGTALLTALAGELAALPAARRPKLHLVGHSAGAVLFGHLLTRWRALPTAAFPFESLVLFAPACTHDFFGEHYRPALQARVVGQLHHMLLDDDRERDDHVALVYRKSILYLVSRSYQKEGTEVPILGMQKFLKDLDTSGIPASRVHHHLASDRPPRTETARHTEFDNDLLTMNSTLEIVLGKQPARPFRPEEMKGY
jgi:hypothetical protein